MVTVAPGGRLPNCAVARRVESVDVVLSPRGTTQKETAELAMRCLVRFVTDTRAVTESPPTIDCLSRRRDLTTSSGLASAYAIPERSAPNIISSTAISSTAACSRGNVGILPPRPDTSRVGVHDSSSSVTRLSAKADPWLCVPTSRSVCPYRKEACSSANVGCEGSPSLPLLRHPGDRLSEALPAAWRLPSTK